MQDNYIAIFQDLVALILEVDNGRHAWCDIFQRQLHWADGSTDLTDLTDLTRQTFR